MGGLPIGSGRGLICQSMPKAASRKIPYTGYEALYESPPPLDETQIELEMVKRENAELRSQMRHQAQAIAAAVNLLLP